MNILLAVQPDNFPTTAPTATPTDPAIIQPAKAPKPEMMLENPFRF